MGVSRSGGGGGWWVVDDWAPIEKRTGIFWRV